MVKEKPLSNTQIENNKLITKLVNNIYNCSYPTMNGLLFNVGVWIILDVNILWLKIVRKSPIVDIVV